LKKVKVGRYLADAGDDTAARALALAEELLALFVLVPEAEALAEDDDDDEEDLLLLLPSLVALFNLSPIALLLLLLIAVSVLVLFVVISGPLSHFERSATRTLPAGASRLI
jgi:hypothetical protein